MKHRNLQPGGALALALATASLGAAEATIDVPNPSPPRQDLIDSRNAGRTGEQRRLRAELLEERLNLQKLRVTYSELHPTVMQSNRKIEELEKRLRELGVDVSVPPGAQPPTR